MIHVLIAAPYPAIRVGLRQGLEAGWEVNIAAEASSPPSPGDLPSGIDVLVAAAFDLDELSVLARLEGAGYEGQPYPAVLYMGDDLDCPRLLRRLPLPAWGFLPLEASIEECLAAVHALSVGLAVCPPHIFSQLSETPQEHLPLEFLPEALSGRELEVLQLLAGGLANKQIAVLLNISEHTVKFHVSSICSKLNAANRTEAVRLGLRLGLISL